MSGLIPVHLASQLAWDFLNWHSMIIEIVIGSLVVGGLFFWLQHKASKNTDKVIDKIAEVTQQKATREQKKKEFECQRIIDDLQEYLNAEQDLKKYLSGYKVEEPRDLINGFGLSFHSLASKNIYDMYDAVGQLQTSLNDPSLRKDFLNYLGAFNVIHDRILKYNQPQQEHERMGLLDFVDKQMKKIQEFIEKFKKEMASS